MRSARLTHPFQEGYCLAEEVKGLTHSRWYELEAMVTGGSVLWLTHSYSDRSCRTFLGVGDCHTITGFRFWRSFLVKVYPFRFPSFRHLRKRLLTKNFNWPNQTLLNIFGRSSQVHTFICICDILSSFFNFRSASSSKLVFSTFPCSIEWQIVRLSSAYLQIPFYFCNNRVFSLDDK